MTDAKVWGHDELAADLAQYLLSDKRMVWEDMQLGPSGSARPDVFTLERSYSRPLPTAYECKISRADLRSDTTSGKWQSYLKFAGAVIFAVPDGLCKPTEIPEGCGLIVRKDKVWRNVRKATRRHVALPMDACMKLLLDGVSRTTGLALPAPRRADVWREHKAIRKKFGEAVASAARDIANAEQAARDAIALRDQRWEQIDRECAAHREVLINQAKEQAAEFEGAKRELIEWLGLEHAPSKYAVHRRIAEIRGECNADARVQNVERMLDAATNQMRATLNQLEGLRKKEGE